MSTVYCPVCRGLGAVDMLIDYLVLMTNASRSKYLLLLLLLCMLTAEQKCIFHFIAILQFSKVYIQYINMYVKHA